MSFWIDEKTTLHGKLVDLIPMQETHFTQLINIASDKRIWEYYPYNGSDVTAMKRILEVQLTEKEKGIRLPFVIVNKSDNTIVGSTSLMDIQPAHKKLEIGTTWLTPKYWATAVNPECKLLLLSFCFEQAGCYRVQFKTDENNMRSRKAIAKIGGAFEGILRNDMLRENGTHRHSAYFSIIDNEWPEKKEMLMKLLHAKMP